jgi:hypothetical protein
VGQRRVLAVAGRARKKPFDGFADQFVAPGERGERVRQAMTATIKQLYQTEVESWRELQSQQSSSP